MYISFAKCFDSKYIENPLFLFFSLKFLNLLLTWFLFLQSIRNNADLSEAQSRLVDLYISEFVRNGAAMKESQKQELSIAIKKVTEEQKKYK